MKGRNCPQCGKGKYKQLKLKTHFRKNHPESVETRSGLGYEEFKTRQKKKGEKK